MNDGRPGDESSTVDAQKLDDLYAWPMLAPLLVGYPYLPFTGAALRPFCLAHILNEIVVNGRREIVEFGGGLSTLLMARLIARNRLPARVVTVEHDAGWAATLEGMLAGEESPAAVEILRAPLAACRDALDGNLWYAHEVLVPRLAGRSFDLAVVDGPPAWEPGRALARYPALAFLTSRMASSFALFLDDANRPGERAILDRWSATGLRFSISGRSLAIARVGGAHYTEPLAYYP